MESDQMYGLYICINFTQQLPLFSILQNKKPRYAFQSLISFGLYIIYRGSKVMSQGNHDSPPNPHETDLNPLPCKQHQKSKPGPNSPPNDEQQGIKPSPKAQLHLSKYAGSQKREQEVQNSKESDDKLKLFEIKSEERQIIQKNKSLQKNQIKTNKLNQRNKVEQEHSIDQSQKQLYKENFEIQVQPYVQKYLKTIPIDLTESETARRRAEEKQKLFKNLVYGMLQIKGKKKEELSGGEEEIKNFEEKQLYDLAMKICGQLDDILQKKLIKRWNMRRFLKFYRELNVNLIDKDNQILRSNIATKVLPVASIPDKPEQFFYSQPKKKKSREAILFLLRQNENPKDLEEQRLREQQAMKKKELEQAANQPKPQPTSRYYNQDKLLQLNKYLKQCIPECLKQNLDLLNEQKDMKDRLTKNLKQVYEETDKKEREKG